MDDLLAKIRRVGVPLAEFAHVKPFYGIKTGLNEAFLIDTPTKNRLIRDDPALGQRIHPGGPDIWAQVAYARDQEWALTVDDITRRRTTLTIRGLDTPQIRDSIGQILG